MAKDPTAGSILADNFYGKTFHGVMLRLDLTIRSKP